MQKKRPEIDHLSPKPEFYSMPFTVDEFNAMPYRLFGNSGLRVSNIGLGTWKFGYPETGDAARVAEKMAFKILDKAIDSGVTFWDSANRYNASSGNSERIIGKWFANNPGQRRNVELATKLYGMMDGKTPNHCRLSRVNILEATYACLDRLQTDRVEIMQFHSYDDTTPIEESLMAIEDLISQDIIRYFGVSNFTVGQLEKYSAFAEKFMRARIRSVQNQFDILYGESAGREGVLEYCAKNKLSFIPYSPLRGGLLTARYLDKSKVGAGDRLVDENTLDQELTEPIRKKLTRLNSLANKWEISLSQLTIAYMLHLPGMGPVIASCSTVEQLVENAKAGKISLDSEQMAAVEKIVNLDYS